LRIILNTMAFFDRFKKNLFEDPVFGKLQLQQPNWWRGEIEFEEGAGKIGVSILANELRITNDIRESYLTLKNRYAELRPKIGDILFNLAQEHISEFFRGLPRPTASNEIWELLSLIAIAIEGVEKFVLTYNYREGVDDTLFDIKIEGTQITGQIFGD
jgi:hypothetical protein